MMVRRQQVVSLKRCWRKISLWQQRTPYLGHLQDTRPGSRRNLRETSTYSIKGVLFSSQEFLYGQKNSGKYNTSMISRLFQTFSGHQNPRIITRNCNMSKLMKIRPLPSTPTFLRCKSKGKRLTFPMTFKSFKKPNLRTGKLRLNLPAFLYGPWTAKMGW